MTASSVGILIAEDNSADAELILESLRRQHLAQHIHVVCDGVEALDFLFRRGRYAGRALDTPPRLVMLDVKPPKVGGLEVLRAVKQDSVTRVIPVVMLTSSNIERDVALAYELGANSYIQKPVDFERFRERVLRIGLYWLTVNEPAPSAAPDTDAA